MVYLQQDDKIISIKPQAKEDCRNYLYRMLDDILSIANYLTIDSRYTEVKAEIPEQLGILEEYKVIGFSKSTGLPIYYYQKNVNKFLGVIRLLTEILYNNKKVVQDFTVFFQRLFYEKDSVSFLYGTKGAPVDKEMERLTKLVERATDRKYLKTIRTCYPDFTLFWEKLLPYINFDMVTGEWDLPAFEAFSRKIKQPNNIIVAENNAKILTLADKAPRFMI